MATKTVLPLAFTFISTSCLPCDFASTKACRTWYGLDTAEPLTLSMTSPVSRPCWAATPSESTAVMITPLALRLSRSAGASITPRWKPSPSVDPVLSVFTWCSPGIWPSTTSSDLAWPLRRMSSLMVDLGAEAPILRVSSRASLTEVPFAAVMTSPDSRPALAAGVSGLTSSTSAP